MRNDLACAIPALEATKRIEVRPVNGIGHACQQESKNEFTPYFKESLVSQERFQNCLVMATVLISCDRFYGFIDGSDGEKYEGRTMLMTARC
jgi:hypothetical protein